MWTTASERGEVGTTEHRPRVSVGIPVYNGVETLPRALDSLLAQTFADFEIVISDNASEDGTHELCLEYEKKDPRIRYLRNDTNIGQIANFNRVFELSTGEYFRWAGCNDWWAPEYLERCVDALDRNPTAILVTCYQAHYDEDDRRFYEEYKGPRIDSDLAHQRFRRMLWFFQASRCYIDPIYSVMRRSALLETPRLRNMIGTDLVLAAELSLIGPFCHVPKCLAFRRLPSQVPRTELLRRYDPTGRIVDWSLVGVCCVMASLVRSRSLGRVEQLWCFWTVLIYFVRRLRRVFYGWCRSVVALRTRYRALKRGVRAAIGWERLPTKHDTGASNRTL